MKKLQIFDPAMCCSTGVCGPSVDAKLVKLAADVSYLKNAGIEVERFNLGHQPGAFTKHPLVLAEMGAEAENLPIFVVDGVIKAKSIYPDRKELASWFGLPAEVSATKTRTLLKSATDEKCCGGEGCC